MEVFKDLKFNLFHLNSSSSTNIHAHQYLNEHSCEEGTVFYTDFQLEGKGQRGARWQSDRGLNLLMSIVLHPNIEVDNRFLLSQAISLAIYDCLDKLSVRGLSIKWPNDILVENRKIGGILIENSIKGNRINNTIVGIGLNINQTDFSEMERKATSLKLELHKENSVLGILNQLLDQIRLYYVHLFSNPITIETLYNSRLYGKDCILPFQDETKSFDGIIQKVNSFGELLIRVEDDTVKYGIKEIKFKA